MSTTRKALNAICDHLKVDLHEVIKAFGTTIPETGYKTKKALIAVVTNPKNWRICMVEKHRVWPGVVIYSFDCEPFDDQLRGYVYVDSTKDIIHLEVQGE